MLKRLHRQQEELSSIKDIVTQVRQDHPTMCTRYIYHKVRPKGIGRDRFERFCADNGLMSVRKVRSCRTTNSSGVMRFDNMVDGLVVSSINQVWQSDITYFDLGEKFAYITFVTDRFSSRIVGHSVSEKLFTEDTVLPALKRAVKTRKGQNLAGLIFHSDGGGQYYSRKFLKETSRLGFRNSMCTYPWENGLSERINGIIKNNYLIHWNIHSFEELTKAVDRAVSLYNEDKPHIRLKRLTPVEYEKKLSLQSTPPAC